MALRWKPGFIFLLSIIFCLLFCGGCKSKKAMFEEKAAVDGAVEWLNIVDSNDYLKSWRDSSVIVQKIMTGEEFQEYLLARREPLGGIRVRRFYSIKRTFRIRNAPEGRYYVILFESEFERQKGVVEKVTVVKSQDSGKWLVCGYIVLTEKLDIMGSKK